MKTNTSSYIDNYSDKENLYRKIRDDIIFLDIKPGERFSETSIATKLKAGRVAVREAITQLNEEGYVEVLPQKGTFVAKINLEKIKQAAYAHTVLEQAIVEEILNRGLSKSEIDLLKNTLKAQKQEKEQNHIMNVILKEYQILYHLSTFCDRGFVWEVFRTLDSHLLRIQYLQYSTFVYQMQMSSLTNIENSVLESSMLIDNIMRGDKGNSLLIMSNRYTRIMWQAEMMKSIYPQYFSS
jgi:Transcriptional regulators